MFPFTGLRLLLPAIVPSWRFFDAVSASPRLEYALLTAPENLVGQWQAFRPRPPVLSLANMLRRLLWNPEWNENLFVASLSERLMSVGSSTETVAHSQRELLLRVMRHVDRHGTGERAAYLQIRLRMVRRTGPQDEVGNEIVYLSSPYPTRELMTA